MSESDINLNEAMPKLGRVSPMGFLFGMIQGKNDARALATLAGVFVVAVPALAGTVVPITMGIAALLTDKPEVGRVPLEAYLLLGIGAASAAFVAVMLIQRWHQQIQLRRHDFQNQLEIMQAVSMCLVHSKTKIIYRHRYLIKSRIDGLRVFPLSYTWSGSGTVDVKLQNPNFSYKLSRIAPGSRRLLEVDLGRAVPRNHQEVIEFDFVTVGCCRFHGHRV